MRNKNIPTYGLGDFLTKVGSIGGAAAPILSAIPGLNVAAPVISGVSGLLGAVGGAMQSNQEKAPDPKKQFASNPWGFAMGGSLNREEVRDYVFSKRLGTADELKKIMKKLNAPKGAVVSYKGKTHAKGGIPINENYQAMDGSTSRQKMAFGGRAIAELEGGEARIEPSELDGMDDISKNTAKLMISKLMSKNESMRMAKEGQSTKFPLGGYLTSAMTQGTLSLMDELKSSAITLADPPTTLAGYSKYHSQPKALATKLSNMRKPANLPIDPITGLPYVNNGPNFGNPKSSKGPLPKFNQDPTIPTLLTDLDIEGSELEMGVHDDLVIGPLGPPVPRSSIISSTSPAPAKTYLGNTTLSQPGSAINTLASSTPTITPPTKAQSKAAKKAAMKASRARQKDGQSNSEFLSEYTPLLLGQAAQVGSMLPALFRGPEKETLQLNPNRFQIEGEMRERQINLDPMRNQIVAARDASVRGSQANARSASLRNALTNAAYARAGQNMANVSMQEQQIRNQYKAELAQTLNNLGMQESQERIRKQIADSQNLAAYDTLLQTLGASAAETGKFMQNDQTRRRMADENFQLLNQRYTRFKSAEDLKAYKEALAKKSGTVGFKKKYGGKIKKKKGGKRGK